MVNESSDTGKPYTELIQSTKIIMNILDAASHANPYPYYASLRQGPALAYDSEHKCWIASRANVVTQVLENPACAVRPTAEPVPRAITGGHAGEVFSRLMRMNEGPAHHIPKQVMQTALHSMVSSDIAGLTRHFSVKLSTKHALGNASDLNKYLYDLPVHVMGTMLGFSEDALAQLCVWMADFVQCLSPLSTAIQIDAAHSAAQSLRTSFSQILENSQPRADSLLARVQTEAKLAGWAQTEALLANLTGLLSQTYEATAGLIGNCITSLITHVDLLTSLRTAQGEEQNKKLVAELAREVAREVARYDAPIQNTRRFVNHACEVAGQTLQAGDVIVVLLAAANRDAAVNPLPDMLQLHRPDRKVFTFGLARHACPGQFIAEQVAASALMHLLRSSVIAWQNLDWTYRPSLNARIPVFTHRQEIS